MMHSAEEQAAAQPVGQSPSKLEKPVSLSPEQLEEVAGGTVASLLPGVVGPTSGMLPPEPQIF